VIEQILPAEAACAEAFTDPPGAVLFPEEEALIAKAGEKRRREFSTARGCAHSALAVLGSRRPPSSSVRRVPRGGRTGLSAALRTAPDTALLRARRNRR
jgi:4'-phosphopantetheinyl transferase EntD